MYYVTSHVTDHIFIRFYDIIIAFFLNTSFDEYVDIWDYDLVKESS